VRSAVLAKVLFHDLSGKAVYYDKEVCRSVLSRDALCIHLSGPIGCIDIYYGINNPLCRTAVIVSVVQEIILLQDTEDLLPVDLIVGVMQVLCDLLLVITDEFPPEQLPDLFQDLRVGDLDALISR